jgi:superfamily II DNA or RNA helicase
MSIIKNERLKFFKSLFKGREDVFAIHWEKEEKSGYMPAYDLDWDAYRTHKAKGGNFQTFTQKTYKQLTDEEILKHIEGNQLIGIYPLLSDNTSWFIAADFDEENWAHESIKFLKLCLEMNLSAYLERSRSGNGAHVWLFFERAYPAIKSRKIIISLLKGFGIIGPLDKSSSFDRLFPNQDYLSGKGFGNLIALPLHGKSYKLENSCFIDHSTLQPLEPQWDFLNTIQKIPIEQLDKVYETIINTKNISHTKSSAKLQISLNNKLHISRNDCPLSLLNLIKEQLNFLNSEYIIKKKAGLNTWNTPAYFKVMEEENGDIIIPRGMTGKVLRFCKEQKIEFDFFDQRVKLPPIELPSIIQLKDFQETAVEPTRKKDLGILSAPPGTGKTIMGLAIIAEKRQPALIIVHRQQLAEQWKESIQTFLKIPKHEIGYIGQGELKIGKKITIAMIQSLTKQELEKLKHSFGIVLIDECHHIPAETYRNCIEQFHSYFLYGLTATPFRKSNDKKLLFAYLGDVIAEVPMQILSQNKAVTVLIRNTNLDTPFDSKTDKVEILLKILIHDSDRNRLILSDIDNELSAGRKTVIITERKEQIEVLRQYLKQHYEVITLSGDDNESQRKQKWKLLQESDFDVLITTGQLFGEGFDLHSIDCLFLVYPFSFEGKLVQYIGRVQRGEYAPIIYDYRDHKIDYLEKLFQHRNSYYRKLTQKGILKQNTDLVIMFEGDTVKIIGTSNLLSIKDLDLPDSIEKITDDTNWLVRILKHEPESESLFCEILNYDYKSDKEFQITQQFLSIRQIRFRSLDTSKLLGCAIIKKQILRNPAKSDTTIVKADISVQVIKETIKIPVSTLEFNYGIIRFSYFSQQLFRLIIFEITNQDIRPEFEVLKPYFAKALKSKKVSVSIQVEIQNDNIISQRATSFDLERINQEVIEGMKFNFVMKEVLKRNSDRNNLLNLKECLDKEKSKPSLYKSEREFIDDLLKWKNVKHFHQLKYLAKHHDISIIKIRFLLMPFSFAFFISGEKQFHVVLETLDTEEATYIWHFDKHADNFVEYIRQIDLAITQLRSEGRQAYLDSKPKNFSRILHDYSDPKRGFVLWKGQFEEKIV